MDISEQLFKSEESFVLDIVGGPLSYVSKHFENPLVIQKKIRFHGVISNEKLNEVYRRAHIGVLPFFSDTPLVGGRVPVPDPGRPEPRQVWKGPGEPGRIAKEMA